MLFLYIYIYIYIYSPDNIGVKNMEMEPVLSNKSHQHQIILFESTIFSLICHFLAWLSLSLSPPCRKLNVVIYSRLKFLFNFNTIQDIYISCFSSYNRITLESFWRRASCVAPFRRKCFDVRCRYLLILFLHVTIYLV